MMLNYLMLHMVQSGIKFENYRFNICMLRMEYYPAAPPESQLYTTNYVADTKLEYLIIMSNRFRTPIENLPYYLGPRYWPQILLQAIIAGDIIEMDRVMNTQGIHVNITLWKNLTPIWFATQYGHFHIVQNLILRNANVNIYDKDIKMSCLDIALSRNYKRTAYLLLAYGARTFKRLTPMLPEEAAEEAEANAPVEKKEQ
jgi:hypothetical protein